MSADDIITTGVAIDTTGIDKGIERLDALAATGPKVDKSLQSVEQSAAKTGKSLATLGQGSGAGLQDAAQKVDQSSRTISQSMQRTADAATASDKAHKDASKSIDGIGVSAAQTAAAMRQLPAQFSDIVTSIQGGQRPLSVFLQQGSQIKDSFGGAGEAAKAMAGYIGGLLSPFSIATAAAAGLTLAYYKGSQEAQEFRKTLILTGNAAGVTASQLMDMSAAIKAMGGGTQGRAAEILNQMAASGLIGAENLAKFTDAALRLEKVGGPAAEETRAAFESLGRAPASAAAKLNESTNFLTRSLYEQIKALEDQGKTVDAARVAQEAYADVLNQRSPQLLQNLGYIERAWLAVKDAVKGTGDALVGIGRPSDTLGDQIKALRARIESNNFDASQGGQTSVEAAEKGNAILVQRLRLLEQGAKYEQLNAYYAGESADKTKAGNKWEDEKNKYLTNQESLKAAIVKLQNEGLAAGISQLDIEKRIAIVKQQYDIGAPQEEVKRRENAQLESTKRQLIELNALRATGFINEREFIEKSNALTVKDLEIKRAATVQELALSAKRINSEKEQQALKTQVLQLDEQIKTARLAGDKDLQVYLAKRKLAIDAELGAQKEIGKTEVAMARVRDMLASNAADAAVRSYTQAIQEQNDQTQFELTLLGKTQEARDIEIEQYKIRLDLQKQIQAVDDPNNGYDQAQRDQKKAELEAAAAIARANAINRSFLNEWQRTADKIGDTLTDALMRGFESGKGFIKNLRDAMVNTFKTTVLQPVIKAIVSPVANIVSGALSGIGGSIASSLGLGALFGAGSAAASGVLGAGVAGAAAGGGLFSLGLQGSLAGFGELGILGGASSALTSAGSLLSAGSFTGALGAALPVLGPLALGAFLLKDAFNGGAGTPHRGAQYISDGTNGYVPAGLVVGDMAYGDSVYKNRSQEVEDALKALTGGSALVLNNFAKNFGKTADFKVGAYFASDNHDPSQGNITVFHGDNAIQKTSSQGYDKDPTKGYQQFTADLAKQVRTAMESIGIPDWAKGMLDKLGEAPAIEDLAKTVDAINLTQTALLSLGKTMPQLAGLTDSAVTALLGAFNGIQGLSDAANSYYANFYTDAERSANVTRSLTEELGKLGFSLPTTREGFRALVEAQDLTTEAGQKAYAALLQLSPAFASVVEATKTLSEVAQQAADQLSDAGRKVLEELAQQQGSLMVELLKAQGKAGEAAALERSQYLAKATQGLTDADRAAIAAAYDLNKALQDQIEATNAAAQAAQQVASQRYDLESQLLQLQGNTAELRRRELEALDPSNRALLENIYALQDQQSAAQQAAQALQRVSDVMAGLGNARFDLENQLLGLQGNTAEVLKRTRENDLAELTKGLSADEAAKVIAAYDYNASLKQQIEAFQAAQQAAAESARQAEQAAQAASQLKQAWQSVTDSIFDEVQRIRDLIGGNTADNFAQVQARFAITTAQARAGDQDAAKLLPSLAQTMLSLAESQATSLFELQRIRAQAAGSLESTGNTLAGRFGLTLPKFAAGTNYVPEDMVAVIHQGEAIIPRAFNPMAGGASANAELLAELRALRQETRENARSIANLQLRGVQVLEQWDGEGMPAVRT